MSETSEFLCLDRLAEAIIVADASGRVLYLNRRARGLFGHEVLAHPGTDDAERASSLTDLLRGFPDVGQLRDQVGPPGEPPVPIEMACVRLDGSVFAGAVCASVAGDRVFISIRPSAAAAHREAAAEAALQQQRDLFSLLNHDVRQSLQAIQFISETLAPSAPEAVSVIGEILASVRRLLDTGLRLNDAGVVTPVAECCALAEILQKLRRELEPVARRKGLSLQVAETAEHVHTDPVLLRELLQNLVANAIRYTRAGHVRVECCAGAASVRVEITDTGLGMSEAQIERIFAPKGRESGAATAGGGSGLGLVIVKRLADALGYKVEVASRLGAGSSFAVTIPRTPGRFDALRVAGSLGAGAAPPASFGAR